MGNRQVAERYTQAAVDKDFAVIAELASQDIEVRYPQSGEVIRGIDNYIAMLENYPGGVGDVEITKTHGSKQDVTVTTPSFGMPLITVTGNDTTFIVEGIADYSNGEQFHSVGYLEIRNMKVVEETTYFARPFEAPAWRRPYVEG